MGFGGPETPKILPPTPHPLATISLPPISAQFSGGGDVEANGCAVGGDILGVYGPQNRIFVRLGRETAQKWLRNGQRNGQVSAKPTESASPRGNKLSWRVAFPSDQASRRASPTWYPCRGAPRAVSSAGFVSKSERLHQPKAPLIITNAGSKPQKCFCFLY